jgi:hypothetical protein
MARQLSRRPCPATELALIERGIAEHALGSLQKRATPMPPSRVAQDGRMQ